MLSLRHVTTISLGLLLSLTGCETGATGKAPPPGQATAALASDWRADLETTRDQVKKNDPALYSELTALQPRKTRAGFPRFISKALHRPEAFAFLVDRFLTGDDPEPVRAALIEAMPATQFAFGPAAVDLFLEEESPLVRGAIMGVLARADVESAHRGLALGLEDESPEVRTEAARVAGARDDGTALEAHLLRALGDSSPDVRATAARSAGLLGLKGAVPHLIPLLQSERGEVRLHALRAIDRLDHELAGTLPTLDRLRNDTDSRVANLASSL